MSSSGTIGDPGFFEPPRQEIKSDQTDKSAGNLAGTEANTRSSSHTVSLESGMSTSTSSSASQVANVQSQKMPILKKHATESDLMSVPNLFRAAPPSDEDTKPPTSLKKHATESDMGSSDSTGGTPAIKQKASTIVGDDPNHPEIKHIRHTIVYDEVEPKEPAAAKTSAERSAATLKRSPTVRNILTAPILTWREHTNNKAEKLKNDVLTELEKPLNRELKESRPNPEIAVAKNVLVAARKTPLTAEDRDAIKIHHKKTWLKLLKDNPKKFLEDCVKIGFAKHIIDSFQLSDSLSFLPVLMTFRESKGAAKVDAFKALVKDHVLGDKPTNLDAFTKAKLESKYNKIKDKSSSEIAKNEEKPRPGIDKSEFITKDPELDSALATAEDEIVSLLVKSAELERREAFEMLAHLLDRVSK